MTSHIKIKSPLVITTAHSLSNALDRSEQIKELVEECAYVPSRVNSTLKNSLAAHDQKPDVKDTPEKAI